jgi:hypothetical protein
MGFQRFLPGVSGAGGSGINLPDDHIFSTTEARDAAIPSPKEGEQCAVQAGEPQYHLLQEYRVDAWVDITYVIRGPKGDSGGGSGSDPSKGFTLDKNTAIKTQMPDGTSVDVILADDLKDLFIGNLQQCMQLKTACNGIYVQYDEGEGRILLDDEGAPGIKLKNITDTAYCSFDYQGWATIITDHSSGDICYFVQSFKGALFSGLPASITLDPDTDYVIASEVTQRKGSTGFAHRLSIVSTAEGEDDANNRTIQRAGSNFDHAKAKWSEVMLKRDAVVFDNMLASTPEVFSTIVAGDNMSGSVVDGVLTLSSTGGSGGNTFDTLTTRLMRVHESPENSGKFTEWSVDENFNTEVYAVGDTHYYAKNKSSGDLVEAYQVFESGKVGFKNTISASDGVENYDVVNVKQLNAALEKINELESTVNNLQQLVEIEGQKLTSLEASNGNSVRAFEMYSSTPNTFRMDMEQIDGDVISKEIELGNAPPPGPGPTPGDEVTVYWGWDINSRGLIEASDIVNYQGNDERTADTTVTADTLLTLPIEITRNSDEYKYSYIAYPKDLISPNPMKVEYSGFIADWPSRQMEINGLMYIVLVSEWPNKSLELDMKLHQ